MHNSKFKASFKKFGGEYIPDIQILRTNIKIF